MGYWGVFNLNHGTTKIVFQGWSLAGGQAATSQYLLNSSGILKTIDFAIGGAVNAGLMRILLYLDDVQVLPACDPSIWTADFDSNTRPYWITTYAINGSIYCGYNFVDGIRFDNKLEVKVRTVGIANPTGGNIYIWYEELAS